MKSQKYLSNFYCNQHPQQKLNLVCIQQHCLNRGLICSLCKSDQQSEDNPHRNHFQKIVPFKNLIQSLDQSVHKSQMANPNKGQHMFTAKILQIHNETLYILQEAVVQMSKLISQMQQILIDRFESSKSSILYRGERLRKFKSIIERSLIHNVKKQDKYQLLSDMRWLISFIKENKDLQFRSKYELNLNSGQIVAAFTIDNDYFRQKCEGLKKFLQKTKDDAFFKPRAAQGRQLRSEKKTKKTVKQEQLIASQPELVKEVKKDIKVQNLDSKKQLEDKPLKKQQKQLKKKKIIFEAMAQLKQEELQAEKIKQKTENPLPVKNPKAKKQKNIFQQLQDVEPQAQSSFQPLFDNFLKHETIKLTQKMKVAKQTKLQGFAFINTNILHHKKITFKIKKLQEGILVGFANFEMVNAYKLGQYSPKTSSHGIIGIDNKGLCLNYRRGDQPSKETKYTFHQNDIINIELAKEVVLFERIPSKSKKNVDSWNFEVKVKIKEEDYQNHHFCVYLEGTDDSVQIL